MIKRKKPVYLAVIIALLLSLILVISAVPAVLADKGDSSVPGTTVVTNGIYTLSVEDDTESDGAGTFTIGTGEDHPNPGENVLYAGASEDPWSSYLTVRVYDTSTEYVSSSDSYISPSSGYGLEILDDYFDSVSEDDNEVTTYWTTPEGLDIEQVTAIEGTDLEDSRVRVTTTVTNNGESAVDIGIRYELDLEINGSDDSWFRERSPDDDWTATEIAFEPPEFEMWETTNDPEDQLFNVFGSISEPSTLSPSPTPPERFVYAYWSDAYDSAFDYTPTPYTGYDSAVLYYWGVDDESSPIGLSIGESTSVTMYLFALPPGEEPMPEEAEPPKAAARASVSIGTAPLQVQFFDMSTGDNIVDWYWSFGDGSYSEAQYPTHTYQNGGTYEICLTIGTEEGEEDTACLKIVVEEEVTAPELLVRNLYISATQAQPRQQVMITADVFNEGGAWGSGEMQLLINGYYEQSVQVGVSPGTSQPISFTVYKVTPGEYQVVIGNATGTFYVVEEAQQSQVGGIPMDSGTLIALIVIGVFVIAALVVAIVVLKPS
jgi:PKD repeat protein